MTTRHAYRHLPFALDAVILIRTRWHAFFKELRKTSKNIDSIILFESSFERAFFTFQEDLIEKGEDINPKALSFLGKISIFMEDIKAIQTLPRDISLALDLYEKSTERDEEVVTFATRFFYSLINCMIDPDGGIDVVFT